MKLPDKLFTDESLGFCKDPSPFDRDRYEAIVRDIDDAIAAFLESEYPLTRKPLQAAIKKLIITRYGLSNDTI